MIDLLPITLIIPAADCGENGKAFLAATIIFPPRARDGLTTRPHSPHERIFAPRGPRDGKEGQEAHPMAVSTRYGVTSWDCGQLRLRYQLKSAGRAKEALERCEVHTVETLAPPFVRRGVRPDQTVEAIWADLRRMILYLADEATRAMLDVRSWVLDPAAKARVQFLVKLVYDRAATDRLDAAAKRFPSETSTRPVRSAKERIA